jgi:hypothetical protein
VEFQSAAHEQSYRNACKAVAWARREAYYAAASMTTPELRKLAPAYRAEVPGPVAGEALAQLRMVKTVVKQRTRSPRSRARAASQRSSALARRAARS